MEVLVTTEGQSAGRLIGWEFWLVPAWLSICGFVLSLLKEDHQTINSFALLLIMESCHCHEVGKLACCLSLQKEGQQGINSFPLLIIKESCYGHEVSYGKCWLSNSAIVKPPIRLFMLT